MKKIFLERGAGVLAMALASIACGGDSGQPSDSARPTSNPADFKPVIDNPLFPLSSLGPTVFEGEETDPHTGELVKIRLKSRVLPETTTVAGVTVLVLEEKDYKNGQLAESTQDYFAQRSDGNVYYFGERVDIYEGGQITSHKGQWLAGEGENHEGVYMAKDPQLGQAYEQEKAPGVAEDRWTVVAVNQTLTTQAGTFSGCIKTEDFSPLDKLTEFKYYCPGVGFTKEEFSNGHLDLIGYTKNP